MTALLPTLPSAQAWVERMSEQCDKMYHLQGGPLAQEQVTLFGRRYLKYR
jgi:hypothetical protein